MHRLWLALCSIFFLLSCAPASPPSTPPPRAPHEVIALVGATLFDGTGGDPIPDAVVVIERDRIRAAGTRANAPVPAGARVIDVTGRWIVPGLIDAHVHFFQSGGLYTRPDIADLRRVRPYADEYASIRTDLDDTFRRYLVTGVTSVVDMGGPMWNFDVRDQAAKTPLSPRVAVAGPLISTVARPQFDPSDLPILRADSPDHARALVRQQLARRPDLIKLWAVVTPDRPAEDLPAIARAVIEESHAAGVRVAIHATELETARMVAGLGCDILVHAVTDKLVDDDFVKLLRDKHIVTIPTLVVYEGYGGVLGGQPELSDFEARYGNPERIASWAELAHVQDAATAEAGRKRKQRMEATIPIAASNVKKLHDGGAPIAAGTDAGNIGTLPGVSLHRELQAMVKAGLSPRDVLLSATRDAAKVFGSKAETGTVTQGAAADLLVVDLSPLADIANLQRIAYVVKGGAVLQPSEILAPNPAWVVQKQVEAYGARDLERFLRWYAEDIAIAEHPSGAGKLAGSQELRRVYGKLFADNPELKISVLKRTVQGSMVVDYEMVTGIKGREYIHGAAIYEVKDGLIRRVWFLPKP
jgi:imidazolonepropionase-like amidohydrolase